MLTTTTIEWTDKTWNPTTGCDKISPGCKNCYAATMAKRLQAMGAPGYENAFKLTLQPGRLDQPLRMRKPHRIFVNSMSDLFHKDVPLTYMKKVFAVMRNAHWHTFQVLTKRAERLAELSPELEWAPNIWMGVSVENADYVHRIDSLRSTGAHVKFLSLEPLLGPLPKLNLKGIDWAIVGGESGPGSRPIEADWVRDIRDQCVSARTAFFFKQWGGVKKKETGRELDGRTWDESPAFAGSKPETVPATKLPIGPISGPAAEAVAKYREGLENLRQERERLKGQMEAIDAILASV